MIEINQTIEQTLMKNHEDFLKSTRGNQIIRNTGRSLKKNLEMKTVDPRLWTIRLIVYWQASFINWFRQNHFARGPPTQINTRYPNRYMTLKKSAYCPNGPPKGPKPVIQSQIIPNPKYILNFAADGTPTIEQRSAVISATFMTG